MMSVINMLFYILVGLVSGARAITLSQLEQKFNTLEQELGSLKQKQSNSETKIAKAQNELEYGGKKYETLRYINSNYSCVVVNGSIIQRNTAVITEADAACPKYIVITSMTPVNTEVFSQMQTPK